MTVRMQLHENNCPAARTYAACTCGAAFTGANPSRGAPHAKREGASQGALRAAIALRKEVAAKTIWAEMFIDGEGYNNERDWMIQTAAELIDRESGHVVLLEALRRCEQYIGGHKDENGKPCIHQECNKHNFRLISVLDQIRAAIKQAERGQ